MSAVFLDSVGLIAIWNNSDQWHSAALNAYAELRKSKRTLVTSRYVLLECGNAAARLPIRQDVIALRKSLILAGGLIAPTEDDWNQAWHAYEQGEAAQAGIVDHISFAVMRRLELREAFTNDRHFNAAGFETLF